MTNTSQEVPVISLSEREKERMAYKNMPFAPSPLAEEAGFVRIAENLAEFANSAFSADICNALNDFAFGRSPAVMLRGMPIAEDNRKTPVDGYCDNSVVTHEILMGLGIFGMVGIQPVSYVGENEGLFVRHVVARRQFANATSSHGSSKTFHGHVDNPDLPMHSAGEHFGGLGSCPDVLMLMCIRNTEKVKTTLFTLTDLLSCISAKTRDILHQRVFTVKRPDSFEGSNVEEYNLPLLIEREGQAHWRFDYHNVVGTTPESCQALDEIKTAYQNKTPRYDFILQSGDVLMFKNQATMHSRESFVPEANLDMSRWVLRFFGCFSDQTTYRADANSLALRTEPVPVQRETAC